MDGRTDGWMDGWMWGWMNGWIDGWIEGWMDEWMNEWINKWMPGEATRKPPQGQRGRLPDRRPFQAVGITAPGETWGWPARWASSGLLRRTPEGRSHRYWMRRCERDRRSRRTQRLRQVRPTPFPVTGECCRMYQDSIAMTREDNSRKPSPDLGAADTGWGRTSMSRSRAGKLLRRNLVFKGFKNFKNLKSLNFRSFFWVSFNFYAILYVSYLISYFSHDLILKVQILGFF